MSLTSFFFESDFDYKIPKGKKYKSLYEIKNMAAQGVLDPNNLEKVERQKLNQKNVVFYATGELKQFKV
ncbi:conjugal transfer protein [Orientia tsutsugamushi]|uniref:conjugal transfer protein n=1 Tax=Orientia tsutsugamushi TaxID=784 RepID=UPI003527B361